MGLDNRDYLRDESIRYGEGGGGGFGRGGSAGSQSPVCKRILIFTIIAFVAQIVVTRDWTPDELEAQKFRLIYKTKLELEARGVTGARYEAEMQRVQNLPLQAKLLDMPAKESLIQQWCALDTSAVLSGQIWRLITSGFLHDREDLFHILLNMWFLWMFGRQLETIYGGREFLLFYLTGLAVSGLAFVLLDLVSGDPGIAIGASGAVMAVTMLYALHFPRQVMYLFFVIPIEMRWMVLILVGIDLFPVISRISGSESLADNVAHSAHLGGLAFGYLYGKRNWSLSPLWASMTTWWKAKRRGLKVVRPSVSPATSQKLTDDIDAILKKISEQGEASLTSAERRTLEKASRKLRDRKN